MLLVGEPDPMPVVCFDFFPFGVSRTIDILYGLLASGISLSITDSLDVFVLALEWTGRLWLYPLIREDLISTGIYTNGVTPGVLEHLLYSGLLILFFALSIKRAG